MTTTDDRLPQRAPKPANPFADLYDYSAPELTGLARRVQDHPDLERVVIAPTDQQTLIRQAGQIEELADDNRVIRLTLTQIGERIGIRGAEYVKPIFGKLSRLGLVYPEPGTDFPVIGEAPDRTAPEEPVPDELADDHELTDEEWAQYEAQTDPEPSPVPEPSDSAPEPSEAATAPEEAAVVDSGWRWNPDSMSGSAEEWSRTMIRCRCLDHAPKGLGWLLRETCDKRDGTVYLSEPDGMSGLGVSRGTFLEYRRKLRDAGWIVKTGRRSRFGLQTWELRIPSCGCNPV